ncbi:nicotinamide riboside kinase 1-like [Tachypleus tridentatus]|uniref:nicotinamide riboside kinase 1-like n=1 Tax=Tachypleus tridentatus TaxID=6853 RepID=UPI003FD357FF
MKGWILVGLSGVTCGGKTTLAAMLQKSVTGSIILSQDEFFREEYSDKHEMIPELQHVNWESLSSIDWNSFMSKLFELMRHEPPTGNPLLIVEGHLIFNYFPLMQMFDKKYFIHNKQRRMLERRRVKKYGLHDTMTGARKTPKHGDTLNFMPHCVILQYVDYLCH